MTGTIATMMWTTISTLGFAIEDVDVCQSLPEIASPQEYDTVTLAIMREAQPQYCSEPTPVGVYHMPPQFGSTMVYAIAMVYGIQIYRDIPVDITLWLFNIAMEAMAHRNRWFTF